MFNFVSANCPEYGVSATIGEALEGCEAFTLADTMECTFTTKTPDRADVNELTFPFDGCTVTLNELKVGFMRVDYKLTKTFDDPQSPESETELCQYELRDQNGVALQDSYGHWALDESGKVLTLEGGVTAGESAISAITFVPMLSVDTINDAGIGRTQYTYDEGGAFTVSLEKN